MLVPEHEIQELHEKLERLYVPAQSNFGVRFSMWERVVMLLQNLGPTCDLIPAEVLKSAYGMAIPELLQPAPDVQLEPEFTMTPCQEKAWGKLQKFMASDEPYFLLRGYAGTGKTYLLKKLIAQKLKPIIVSATTNKASKVASEMLGIPARTVYSVLGIRMEAFDDEIRLKYPTIPPRGIRDLVLVVDEASMIGKTLLQFICKSAKALNLKVIFVGDPAQLRPVGERRSPVWSLVKNPECRSFLKEVKRYDDQLLVISTAIRDHLKSKRYDIDLRKYADQEKVIHLPQARFEKVLLKAEGQACAIAWRNRTVDYYNDLIRQGLGFNEPYCVGDRLLAAAPIVVDDEIVATIDEEFKVTEVQPYVATHKSSLIKCNRLSVTSGDLHLQLTLPTPSGEAKLNSMLTDIAYQAKDLNKPGFVRKALWGEFWSLKNKFHKVRYGFARTAHRAQGDTLTDVFMDQQDILANRDQPESLQCLYVAATRATNRLFFN